MINNMLQLIVLQNLSTNNIRIKCYLTTMTLLIHETQNHQFMTKQRPLGLVAGGGGQPADFCMHLKVCMKISEAINKIGKNTSPSAAQRRSATYNMNILDTGIKKYKLMDFSEGL
jgi:hypothetical protein